MQTFLGPVAFYGPVVGFAPPSGGSGAPSPPPNKGGYSTNPATTGPTAWQYLTSIWGGCLDAFKGDASFDAAGFESC